MNECILTRNTLEQIPNTSGVYEILAMHSPSIPKAIARANGVDSEGVLYIGMTTKSLKGRITRFYQCASTPERAGHIAGWNYRENLFSEIFPFDKLKVRWRVIPNAGKCSAHERNLLKNYLLKYKDKPPLNFKS